MEIWGAIECTLYLTDNSTKIKQTVILSIPVYMISDFFRKHPNCLISWFKLQTSTPIPRCGHGVFHFLATVAAAPFKLAYQQNITFLIILKLHMNVVNMCYTRLNVMISVCYFCLCVFFLSCKRVLWCLFSMNSPWSAMAWLYLICTSLCIKASVQWRKKKGNEASITCPWN